MADKNIENKGQDTYDKYVAGNADLFSESGFDEMQKAKNYEIGFKLFRVFYFVMFAASLSIVCVAVALESLPFQCIGAGLAFLCTAFYLTYAAKTAAAGVMNRRFAETMSKKYVLFYGIVILIAWLCVLSKGDSDGALVCIWINLGAMYIGNYLCSRKNMKVLEKMLKEDSENEE